MKNYAIRNLKVILFSSCIGILYSCGSQKDNAVSRSMQNLTARYNYIYNSKVILDTHQQELADSYTENYDQILPVYLGPEIDSSFMATGNTGGKLMDDIIKKSQIIILEKGYSNYLDEAYNLMGKAQFFKGNYFNAAEYFDYTTKNYQRNIKSYIEALSWKARSLMQVRRLSEAKLTLDTLAYAISSLKDNSSEPLATLAQMSIYQQKNEEAIAYLKQAIKASDKRQNKIRWTYILAQLFEQQRDYQEALLNYKKVEKSSAPFEMYFNASLNRIKLNALLSGKKVNRQKELLALLKDDKNTEYNDQIYYQIAESLMADGDFALAKKYYLLSIQKSSKNPYQKGLSYLKIADLNFKQLRNYLDAKLYYDSAVSTLPKSYPGYDLIVKKNENLEYLTKRYEIISTEDTLQAIAAMPHEARLAKIDALFNPKETQQKSVENKNDVIRPNFEKAENNKAQSPGTFYFSNKAALSVGYSEFKKKWGNRKLEENWRQSVRSSAQSTTQDIANNINNESKTNQGQDIVASEKTDKIKTYTNSLPLSPEALNRSNQRIIDAYYDIANFYLQELNAPGEAAEVYQVLLERFPKNNHLAAVYYGLYLIAKQKGEIEANTYKNKLLKEYPNSSYAKIILDPSFSLKQTELETAINKHYNELFDAYQKKNFTGVIQQVDESLKTNSTNHLSPQYAYLKAIAIGRTSHVDTLLSEFNFIVTSFADDRLITPLVNDHINYINDHLAEFKKRTVALIDFDPNEPPFGAYQQPTAVLPAVVQNQAPITVQQPEKPTPVPPVTSAPTVNIEKPVATKVATTESIFTTSASTAYYYVINVADASLTLSSSRFGIGQFNRGNHPEANLKHQLKEFDNDQLIYIGNFTNFEDAKAYADGITPLLRRIMKVPANIYSGFIISKENFDKLTSRDLLNKYLEFYKNNY